jgi:hypothetical protein
VILWGWQNRVNIYTLCATKSGTGKTAEALQMKDCLIKRDLFDAPQRLFDTVLP